MVQDIFPKVFHNQYTYHDAAASEAEAVTHIPTGDDYVMIFQGRTVYLREEGSEIHLPKYSEVKSYLEKNRENESAKQAADQATDQGDGADQSLIYLFSIDDRQYFLYASQGMRRVHVAQGTQHTQETQGIQQTPASNAVADLHLPGYDFMKIFEIRRKKPQHRVFAAETAFHLYGWYRDNAFCGRCGQPTVADGQERMLRCPSCGNMIFPKIAPAVIVAVTRGDEILLTTYANREYKRYALIAGFTEIGETAEETVQREVMEEVGLRVKNIRYYKSQPWGFDSNLLLGFYCEVDETAEGSDEIRMDEKELATAEWVKREDMPEYPEEISLTHEMMMRFKYRRV